MRPASVGHAANSGTRMTRTFDRTLIPIVALALATLVGNAIVGYVHTRQLDENARQVSRTYEVLDSAADLYGTMRDAQSGMRGYLLTGDRRFLELYGEAAIRSGDRLDRLGRLTADNPHQQDRLRTMEQLSVALFADYEQTIAQFDRGDQEAARASVKTGDGKRLMDGIRDAIRAMEAEENRLLRQRRLAHDRAFQTAIASGGVTLLIAILAVGMALWLAARSFRERGRAAALRQQKSFLEATVSSMGDGVIVADADGRVTLMNPVAARLTGWNRDDAAGKPIDAIFRVVDAGTREAVPNPIAVAIAERRVVALSAGTILIAKDGTEWPLDDSSSPILDGDGRATGAVLVFKEISESKRDELALAEARNRQDQLHADVRASEERFRRVVEELAEGVCVVDAATGRFVEANAALLNLLGYSMAEFLALHQLDLAVGETPEVYARLVEDLYRVLARDGRCDAGRRLLRRKDGSTVPVEIRISVARVAGAELHAVIVHDLTAQIENENRMFEYHSQLEQANAKLKSMAITDGLTGLKNRRAFNERLTEEFQRAVRYERPLSILLMDVDHFKLFNDTFGHPAGDEVLRAVAESLRAMARTTDFVARYGGEEFVVLLPDTDIDGAMVLAERFRRAIAARPWDKRSITVSIGVATLSEDASGAAELLNQADEALYHSKRAGRNRVERRSATVPQLAAIGA